VSAFSEKVIQVVKSIPAGQVVSYGQVAAYVGVPRGARQVGWTLRQLGDLDIPWWRVVNNQGVISIKGNMYNDAITQRDHLLQEGVIVDANFTLDIKKYRYIASEQSLKIYGLDKYYVQMIWDKFRQGY
jgi:methylated-DNA-protein-cysteine methyltransferase related protein